ncbi:MAG: nucleotidyl transferase AbiEii/AbiGii toxin family protein [Proteobacteria bacterium]|nr:nucleotidyl transferase AbiEii/AbiGii toxin family protein [Pseudomonadota bacterium]MBU4382110.1 nucleotidyl transferase AbiEii/AbiGii toxin family protein [Pseudomonadota bacterium]MCG2762986.1 nucleotidyl transferase AbiEii/AbiGii toxin family protein [Desulfarculaceae bacterium]
MTGNLESLLLVARCLADLREQLVFVGGSVLELLISDPAQPPVRPTLDVDLVVGAHSWIEFTRQQEKLRELGFREDPNGPICRWNIEGVAVDLMPAEEEVQGYITNRWYAAALRTAEIMVLEGLEIKVISAPCFLATKLEAFDGRGERDFMASHDLEDLVAVVDGREELAEEVARSEPELREYLASRLRCLLDERDFIDALPGHLFHDQAGQARLPLVLERLGRMAAPA